MNQIYFIWNGVKYQVAMTAYDNGLPIRLPSQELLLPGAWLESRPPQPSEIVLHAADPSVDAIDAYPVAPFE